MTDDPFTSRHNYREVPPSWWRPIGIIARLLKRDRDYIQREDGRRVYRRDVAGKEPCDLWSLPHDEYLQARFDVYGF